MAIRCRKCEGKGVEECPDCNGKGKIEIQPVVELGFPHHWEKCDRCHGEGTIPCRNKCDRGWIR